MFLVLERRTLARSATRHKKVDTVFDLPLNQSSQSCFIERLIATERCHERSATSGKHRLDLLHFRLSEQYLTEFMNASLAIDPTRRFQRPPRKPFTASCRMPQRNCIRR